MSQTSLSPHYAGSYYPIYNSGVNQYIAPTSAMPFNEVSTLYVAFAHAYPLADNEQAAALMLEQGQTSEPERLTNLVEVAREANPNIKILISLGWGKNDWTYINSDYTSGANNFPQSVVQLIQTYGLDGFDIDDESVNGSSGFIPQPNFDGVVNNIRQALNQAGAADGKAYYFTITPAGGTAQVTQDNMSNFDLINCQCYGGSYPQEFAALGYPLTQLAWGINSEGCAANFPTPAEYQGLAGIFNWTFSADSVCGSGFKYTGMIAQAVGYTS